MITITRYPPRSVALVRHLKFLILLILIPVAGWADMDAGEVAYRRGDFKTAFSEFAAEAKRGLPRAQGIVAMMYRYGEGVVQNPATAVEWYRLAAKQGYAPAHIALAKMFANGDGVQRDVEQAREWLRRAAEGDNQRARRALRKGSIWFQSGTQQDTLYEATPVYTKSLGISAEELATIAQKLLPSLRKRQTGASNDPRQAAAVAVSPNLRLTRSLETRAPGRVSPVEPDEAALWAGKPGSYFTRQVLVLVPTPALGTIPAPKP
jgi:hypothetical protein